MKHIIYLFFFHVHRFNRSTSKFWDMLSLFWFSLVPWFRTCLSRSWAKKLSEQNGLNFNYIFHDPFRVRFLWCCTAGTTLVYIYIHPYLKVLLKGPRAQTKNKQSSPKKDLHSEHLTTSTLKLTCFPPPSPLPHTALILQLPIYLEPGGLVTWYIGNWELGSKYIGNWKIRAGWLFFCFQVFFSQKDSGHTNAPFALIFIFSLVSFLLGQSGVYHRSSQVSEFFKQLRGFPGPNRGRWTTVDFRGSNLWVVLIQL